MPLKPDEIRSDELSAGEIKDICKEVTARNLGRLTKPSQFAAKNEDAVRQYPDEKRRTNYGYQYGRAPYREDCERIVYTKASERMWGKTQMIPLPRRAHITTRGIHTDRVSQTARSIARELGANEDLAEAIGRGHDLGHAPLGHQGEVLITQSIFNNRQELMGLLGIFKHNIQGLHVVDRIAERRGFSHAGLNLTDQVRHGILAHDGEVDLGRIIPSREITPEEVQADIERYLEEIAEASGKIDFKGDLEKVSDVEEYIRQVNAAVKRVVIVPTTIEGCIVAMTDILHYVGEDLEDLISLGVFQREHIPPEVVQKLGDNGSDIMHTLLSDLVVHSYGRDEIRYSQEIAEILNRFKREFLYKYYYRVNTWVEAEARDPRIGKQAGNLQQRMDFLFRRYFEALQKPDEHPNCSIVKGYLQGRNMHDYYQKMALTHPVNAYQTVIDYIAGFTDQFFFDESEKLEE